MYMYCIYTFSGNYHFIMEYLFLKVNTQHYTKEILGKNSWKYIVCLYLQVRMLEKNRFETVFQIGAKILPWYCRNCTPALWQIFSLIITKL